MTLVVRRVVTGHDDKGKAIVASDERITAAIIGARKVEQLEENLLAADLDLDPTVRAELTDAMPLKLGYPYEWTAINLPNTIGKGEFAPAHVERVP